MRVAGVVAEYNPFHLGHAFHLAETWRRLGAEGAVVCVMSGNFVQRGEAAVLDKWARAECALLGGADLVLELPTPWAVSSAEGFARGAVEVLSATGVVDALSFGCEDGHIEDLTAAADCLLTPAYREALGREAGRNTSFAAARQRAAASLIGGAAGCLSGPNNNLAVEYLKALRTLNAPLEPMAVSRRGARHDAASPEGGFASATAVRELIYAGDMEGAAAWVPRSTAEVLTRGTAFAHAPASLMNCERAVLAKLRTMSETDFAALPDGGASEGLSHRMAEAARRGCSLAEVYALAKTKRYAHARIRRLVLRAWLELRRDVIPGRVPYVRVLGMNGAGRLLLRRMEKSCHLPVVVKPAHAKKLGEEGRKLFELESRCTDLYALCSPVVRPCGLEWTSGPVVL